MIQSNYPVWRLPRDVRQKLRTAGIKATDLVAWAYPEPVARSPLVPVSDRAPYTYKLKPRWSKARKARAAFERRHPGVNDLGDVIFSITPTATPFLMSELRDPGIPHFITSAHKQASDHTHAYTCMACGEWVSVLDVHRCTAQPASADPARRFPDDPASRAPSYLDKAGKGASAARAEIDIMDALRAAVKENW